MPTERLNWDNLRVFMVVAELNSMKAASVRLGESPPTIGRKIDDLETELNVQLLNRSTRGVERPRRASSSLTRRKPWHPLPKS